MTKNLTCIECPLGCTLSVDIENCKVVNVSGNKCPKGKDYAQAEIENPMRVLTSCIVAEGLEIRMVPVRTDAPVPKTRLFEAMEAIKKVRVIHPLGIGDVVIADLLGLKVNVIVTRQAGVQ